MRTKITTFRKAGNLADRILLCSPKTSWSKTGLDKNVISLIKGEWKIKKDIILMNHPDHHTLIINLDTNKSQANRLEYIRALGSKTLEKINQEKIHTVEVYDYTGVSEDALLFTEGLALSNYQFLKYIHKPEKVYSLKHIKLDTSVGSTSDSSELQNLVEATNATRDLVNEPLSFLTATQFSKEIQKLGKDAGFKVTVFNKRKVESMKMGGLLAVNAGSIDPPTFNILEWKPKDSKNKKPIILVGKGVVFDTGGLSLKPTPNSMDKMKCDMAGAAVVAGTIYAVAKNNLPYHVIGLIPATDNRPALNAHVPGDVITMYDGTSVEVLNTDAEGRLILADALTYAKRYKPALVIDLATLTGSAARAIGEHGIVGMGTAEDVVMQKLISSGKQTYERVVAFPLWDEYGEEIKSDIADIKNVGLGEGGAISAGKFLQHFTDYPWIHLDIAGPSYLRAQSAYRPKNGSGIGLRLMYHFIKNNAENVK